jgi:hypothetical protein
MKRKNNLIILILVIITIFLVITINIPLKKQMIPTKFIAGENMGFDLGPGNLNFGQIVPGYSASREIEITNNFESPIFTKIKSSGKISEYIIISENNFILQPNESKKISFSCYPKENIELKEYNGKIIIITRKA